MLSKPASSWLGGGRRQKLVQHCFGTMSDLDIMETKVYEAFKKCFVAYHISGGKCIVDAKSVV